ncbi:hypothetical protein CRE_01898 [Caenorhabditis remanei]|uniref:Uncharacterized protein n=1 Tax=Caenorhabditis remanei TaxID=31234 RepID=E3LG54_CAERE|nr:hypothetical protein CRE_01898 [Caenorhabditis remanei]
MTRKGEHEETEKERESDRIGHRKEDEDEVFITVFLSFFQLVNGSKLTVLEYSVLKKEEERTGTLYRIGEMSSGLFTVNKRKAGRRKKEKSSWVELVVSWEEK